MPSPGPRGRQKLTSGGVDHRLTTIRMAKTDAEKLQQPGPPPRLDQGHKTLF